MESGMGWEGCVMRDCGLEGFRKTRQAVAEKWVGAGRGYRGGVVPTQLTQGKDLGLHPQGTGVP